MSAAYGLPSFVTRDGQPWEKDITQTFGYQRKRIAKNGIENMEYSANTDFASLVIWPCIATSGQLLLRREPFLESGGYDESLHLSEDSCIIKLGWAIEDLKRGRLFGFSKALWRATRSYINYTAARY